MKILFFSRLFYPHVGGVETHVLEISRRLVKKGHEVVVVSEFSTSEESRSLPRHHPRCFKNYKIPVGRSERLKKFWVWRWLWRNRNLISEADIIHCHDVFFWYLPFRFLYFKKPVFTTFHGHETKFPPGKKAIFMRKLSERLSRGNICVGDYLKKWYGTKPNAVIYGGVNKVKSSKLKVQSDKIKLKILFIGRLEEDTGIKIYLKTLGILKKKGIEFEFEACGDGSLRMPVEKYGKVHGFVKTLFFCLARADLIFSSSYLSIFKAISARRPVFSVYENELKEDYLKMTPFAKWLEIANSPEKLAEKIISFWQNPIKYQENVDQFYEWLQKQTWEEVAKNYLALWGKAK